MRGYSAAAKAASPESIATARPAKRSADILRYRAYGFRAPAFAGPGMTLTKILIDHPPVDRRQRDEIGDRRAFVDLMHGLADQTEFQTPGNNP